MGGCHILNDLAEGRFEHRIKCAATDTVTLDIDTGERRNAIHHSKICNRKGEEACNLEGKKEPKTMAPLEEVLGRLGGHPTPETSRWVDPKFYFKNHIT